MAKSVSNGQPFRVGASTWNAILAAAEAERKRQSSFASERDNEREFPDIVLVRNETEGDVPLFGVVGLTDILMPPSDDLLTEFINGVAFKAEKPDDSKHIGRFAIAMQPIPAGEIGRAILSGSAQVKINVTDTTHKFADIEHDSVSQLKSCHFGSAQILWKQTGYGPKWAVVRLSNGKPIPYVLEDCNRNPRTRKPPRYVLNDFSQQAGFVVLLDDDRQTCRTVRRARCNELEALDPEFVIPVGLYEYCDDCKACWKLTECFPEDEENPLILYTNSDFARYKDRIVRARVDEDNPESEEKCFLVERAPNCTQPDTIPREALTEYETCDPCGLCYVLENCQDEEDTIELHDDLARIFNDRKRADNPAHVDLEAGDMVGIVWRILGECYEVTSINYECTEEAFTLGDGQIGKHYEADLIDEEVALPCDQCGCWELSLCSNPEIKINVRAMKGPDGVKINLDEEDENGDLIHEGHVFRSAVSGACYNWAKAEDCDEPIEFEFVEEYNDCPSCVVYTLTKYNTGCDGATTSKTTYTDLLGLYDVAVIVGKNIQDADGVCWEVTDNTAAWAGSVEWNPKPDTTPKPDCETCTNSLKYTLTEDCFHDDCGATPTAGPELVTDFDLHAYIGQYVKYLARCRKVSAGGGAITLPKEGLTDADFPAFPTCDECKAAVVSIKFDEYGLAFIEDDILKQSLTRLRLAVTSICDDEPAEIDELNVGCPEEE